MPNLALVSFPLVLFALASCSKRSTFDQNALPATCIYAPNPSNVWNQLFTAFYYRDISSYAQNETSVTIRHSIGPDLLDPPLGYHPLFLLDDPEFSKCRNLLDEFVRQQKRGLICDPLKRAVMQHDLWAVYDILAQTGCTGEINAKETRFATNTLQESHREELERKIAMAAQSLALTRAEIENLPDTYNDFLRSKGHDDEYNFLPNDLFTTNSEWTEILPGDRPLNHALAVNGRSVFRIFVRAATGSQKSNVAADYIKSVENWRRSYKAWQQLWLTNHDVAGKYEPQRPTQMLPIGTQFILLREMVCLDENWQMVPTRIVESVQFRTSSTQNGREYQVFREADLTRAWLFQGRKGGVKNVSTGDLRSTGYNDLGHLTVDEKGNSPPFVLFPKNCELCHETRKFMSNFDGTSRTLRTRSIEAISQWINIHEKPEGFYQYMSTRHRAI